jgi:hypothetical protein
MKTIRKVIAILGVLFLAAVLFLLIFHHENEGFLRLYLATLGGTICMCMLWFLEDKY